MRWIVSAAFGAAYVAIFIFIFRELYIIDNMKKTVTKWRARKVVTHAETVRTCGECKCGEWNTDSFNYKGEPFQIYCEHSTYAYSKLRECGTCFDDTPACRLFQEGERANWRTKGGRI